MSQDLTIKQITSVPDNIAIRKSPTYLVALSDGKKMDTYFVATKYEEGTNCAKLTGFFCDLDKKSITAGYDDLIKTTDRQNFVEIQIPWHRISHIQSLVFRQK